MQLAFISSTIGDCGNRSDSSAASETDLAGCRSIPISSASFAAQFSRHMLKDKTQQRVARSPWLTLLTGAAEASVSSEGRKEREISEKGKCGQTRKCVYSIGNSTACNASGGYVLRSWVQKTALCQPPAWCSGWQPRMRLTAA
jgi:hypothetical protein